MENNWRGSNLGTSTLEHGFMLEICIRSFKLANLALRIQTDKLAGTALHRILYFCLRENYQASKIIRCTKRDKKLRLVNEQITSSFPFHQFGISLNAWFKIYKLCPFPISDTNCNNLCMFSIPLWHFQLTQRDSRQRSVILFWVMHHKQKSQI